MVIREDASVFRVKKDVHAAGLGVGFLGRRGHGGAFICGDREATRRRVPLFPSSVLDLSPSLAPKPDPLLLVHVTFCLCYHLLVCLLEPWCMNSSGHPSHKYLLFSLPEIPSPDEVPFYMSFTMVDLHVRYYLRSSSSPYILGWSNEPRRRMPLIRILQCTIVKIS